MEEEKILKRQRIYKSIMLVALTAFITCIITTACLVEKYDIGNGTGVLSSLIGSTNDDKITEALSNIENLIEKYYLYDIDEQKAIDGAISGYVDSL